MKIMLASAAFAAALIGSAAVAAPARAQSVSSPQFIVTWKTSGSYVPSFYPGKALPTYGSSITAYLELLSNGRLVDLSSQTIYWYLDENLVGGGVGVQSVTFPPYGEPPSTLDLKVVIPSFNGSYLVHQVEIPMVDPQAVIYAPYPGNQFTSDTATVDAIPYFFNVSNISGLTFAWSANNTAGASNAENPQEAQISIPADTPSGSLLSLSLTITNPNDSTAASATQYLTYQSVLQ